MYVVFTRHGWASGGLQTPQGGRGDGQEAQNGGLVDLFGAHRRVGEFGAECGVECGMHGAWGWGMANAVHGYQGVYMGENTSRNISQMASF